MKTAVLGIVTLLASSMGAIASDQIKYVMDVADFTELKVVNGVNVDYVSNPDSVGKAVFYATKSQASMIMLTNKKGKLVVELSDEGEAQTGLPVIRVYSRFLTKVENSSDSLVRIVSVAPTARFQAKLIGNGRLVVRNVSANEVDGTLSTGNGTLVISGDCQDASLSLVGTGSIQADELKSVNVKCRNTGTGTIGCWAVSQLNISGAGSGKIYYKGAPKIKKSMALGVKVERMPD